MLNNESIINTATYTTPPGLFSFNLVGFIGPLLASFINIYVLWNVPKHLLTYICFFVVNMGTNRLLKLWIRQPRPSGGKSILGEVYTGAHEYGMPSAHAQSVLYSVMYLYFTTNNIAWLIAGLGIAFLTIYQRWAYRRHTIAQLFVGVLVGGVMAYIAKWAADYWITERHFW